MSNTTMTRDLSAARKAMIDSQLRTSGVNEDYVLARMMAVPRENFVPEDKISLAYIDRSIPIGPDAFLASPLFYGKTLQEAAPRKEDRVLVVEGGSGYLAELVRPLVAGCVGVTATDAAAGTLPDDTFSLILVDGAIEQMPDTFSEALEDGGRIVSGLLLRKVTRLASGRKIAGTVSLQPVEDLGMPVLSAFNKPRSWTFS